MRRVSLLALVLFALLLASRAAAQGTYPDKAVHIIVGYPSGGPPDVLARLLGQKFTEAWRKPVVIENVPGAAGSIAAERVAVAPPDGYILGLLSNPELVTNPSLYKLPYDPLNDFAAISQIAVSPLLLVVNNAVPATNVRALIDMARARSGELTFASSGSGSNTHMAGELLKAVARVDIRHVPYKGVPAAIPDLLAGRITMMFSPIVVVLPLTTAGKLRPLAVTSLTRTDALPSVPTVAESGYPGFEVTLWSGFVAPARTPASVIQVVHEQTIKALAAPEIRGKLSHLGMDGKGSSPDEFAAVMKAEIPRWAKLIKASGIKPD
jgi:tripartite-type tricarboxylate transporter receptor subunit TctC